jgi:hypothetical protein
MSTKTENVDGGANDNQKDSSGVDQQNNSKPSYDDLLSEVNALRNKSNEILGEKKKLGEKLKTFEQQNKERLEKELKEKEDFKSLLTLREEELKSTQEKLSSIHAQQIRGAKLDAFLDSVGGAIQPQYWPLIDLEKIVVNTESGEVDKMSVAKACEEFKKTYSQIVTTGNAALTPNAAPLSGEFLTYDNWLKLPLKDQKSRYKEMRDNEEKKQI